MTESLKVSGFSPSELLWLFPLWIFRPFSELKIFSHWSHFIELENSTGGSFSFSEDALSDSKAVAFLFRNSSLLRLFLRLADGLSFFTTFTSAFLGSKEASSCLVFREMVKLEPTDREKLNVCPREANAWQNSRHWVTRAELSPFSPIFTFSSEL